MIRPDDEDKPFVARWNTLVRILLVESSIKLVARTAMDYADLYDGRGVYTGNERMARITGLSERTVRTAWAALRALGMAERVTWGSSRNRKADEYDLAIPDGWALKPILGPNEGRFNCIECGKVFNPSTGGLVLADDGTPTWKVYDMVFCPPPRPKKGAKKPPPSCFATWKRQRGGDKAWRDLGSEVWEMFRKARNDDW